LIGNVALSKKIIKKGKTDPLFAAAFVRLAILAGPAGQAGLLQLAGYISALSFAANCDEYGI